MANAPTTAKEKVPENGPYTIEVRVNGLLVATGIADWHPSKASGQPNLNMFGKVAVGGRYCQMGLNITEVKAK